jgi:hypothetical protein
MPIISQLAQLSTILPPESNVFNASPIDTVVVCATTTAHRADDPGNVQRDEKTAYSKRRWAT